MDSLIQNCELEIITVDGKKQLNAKCSDVESALELRDILAETVNITVETNDLDMLSEED
ncbi:hypothetical protein ACFLVZ_00645 [Chloroflexota bacterium]